MLPFVVLLLSSSGQSLLAGTKSFDFNTDPALDLTLQGNAIWRPTGGVSGTGYLSITDAANGQSGVIVFDEIDPGLLVQSLTFTCDLRTGGGTDNPADGYSVSFARESDPVVQTGTGFAASPGGEANLPEEGTTTGISVGLDEWDSGGGDVVGISVRVDNTLVNQTALPTRNGGPADTTSLQSGPAARPLEPDFSVLDHTFVNLTIQLDSDGTLDVIYKGRRIVDNFQTAYFPSRGRVVFAGRTGGANAHHHVDNLTVTTVAATTPTLTSATVTACALSAVITDTPTILIDITKPITATFAGSAVTPLTVTKTGAETTLGFTQMPPSFFPNGTHPLEITARDTNNNVVTLSRSVTVSPYSPLNASWKAGAGQVDTSAAAAGFRAKIHRLGFARFPGDSNLLPLPERQLSGGFYDSAAGMVAANLATPGTEFDGSHLIGTVIDFDQDGGNGNFPGVGIPGITNPDNDNITGEFFTWLNLPAGCHRLGVNSDDGFTVSFGANALDHFTRFKVGEFNGGRGATDTTFEIAVPEAGLYPVRVIWWEGGGGANVEFFNVLPNGTKVLINDTATPGHIPAFHAGLPA